MLFSNLNPLCSDILTYVETTHLEASRHTRNKERDEEGVLPQ